uniref:Zinc finger protein RFP-like n=1 Tax=Chrysemys picta bellii TaxID=8478 RepID=A0A8C3FX50_CHRPI
MAAENPLKNLQKESTCPICLEYFTEPVTLECGHNFCRACIAQCCEGSNTAVSCPQCRETVQQRNLRLNRQLANVVEIAERLSLQATKGTGGDGVCGEHQETLKLFCEEDETPICVICAIHVPDQPFPYFLQKQTQTERQKIVSEFQKLRRFLEEKERLLLAQLEKLDEEIVRIQNENVSKLSKQISHLSELISEMEGKCQKPASEFLQVRLREKQSSSPVLHLPLCSLAWDWRLPLGDGASLWANVTLDPDTAHPKLILSEDRKSVRWGDTWQRLPNNPERFYIEPCVLGCEGFTSGRHCWEVEVKGEEGWAVGVARESVRRNRRMIHSPEEGIWGVGYVLDQFQALTSPVTPLPLSQFPSRIRVCLDCDRGQVTFIGAGDKAPIFTFPPVCVHDTVASVDFRSGALW